MAVRDFIQTQLSLQVPPSAGRGHVRVIVRAIGSGGVAVKDTELYDILGVDVSADKTEIKRAFRRLAIQYHPDVNSEPSAAEKFIELSGAYEVLADEDSRAAYDRWGLEAVRKGMQAADRGGGSEGGTGRRGAAWEAFDTWDEFQPFERKTRRGTARSAAAARGYSSSSESESEAEGGSSSADSSNGGGGSVEAQVGDVVEFPLSAIVQERWKDGRIKGVGLVVSRNKDRGDRHRLPPENIGLVEIEPLSQEGPEDLWIADPLESAAFSRLEELRVLRSDFERKSDSWRILDALSEGCGSPQYDEEIIV